MNLRLLKTVRGRTTAVAVAVVLVALVVAALGLVVLQRRVLEDVLDSRLTQRVTEVSIAVVAGDDFTAVMNSTSGDDTIVQIVDSSGDVVASTENLDEEHSITSRAASNSVELFDVGSIEVDDHNEKAFRVASLLSETPNGTTLTVYAGSPTENVQESVAALTRGLAIGTPLLVLLLGAVLWTVTGRALRPVEAIRSRADGIGARDLDQRVPTTGSGDEVDRLAETMNRMLGRLQTASEQQRAFVGDASHELRTPITGIITQMEAASSADTIEAYAASAQATLTEAYRMRRLVEDLLSLARGGGGSERRRLVDVDDIVLEEARAIRNLGAEIATDEVSAGQVRGDPDELRRVMRNLLDNAHRHSKTAVVVSLAEANGVVRLEVSDDGPGIPPEDRERIFERFVRLDSARTRHTGGSGLGLAIVKSLVEAHGGTISVTEGALGGARFVVEIPAAERS